MARKLYYSISDDGTQSIPDSTWEEILRLQHWYNSEFFWTAGRLTFKMFAVFQNPDAMDIDEETLWRKISEERTRLTSAGLLQNEVIRTLEQQGLILTKKGGYADGCIASGFTRVATNEWNAYLVCEFLLKVSYILPEYNIRVRDDGAFIKTGEIALTNGHIIVPRGVSIDSNRVTSIVENRRVFSVVDPAKYDNLPAFKTTVSDFNNLEREERKAIVSDWNWLGFDQNYDRNGDDITGEDLNKKVAKFILEK